MTVILQVAFAPNGGQRDRVPNLAVVISFGPPNINQSAEASEGALDLAVPIHMIAIGIGSQASRSELQTITASPANVYIILNYDNLTYLAESLVCPLCK